MDASLMSFHHLPKNIVQYLCWFLDKKTLLILKLTSKHFRKGIKKKFTSLALFFYLHLFTLIYTYSHSLYLLNI